jgi:hypothetical protein
MALGTITLDNEAFLLACIKNVKSVDNNGVAKVLSSRPFPSPIKPKLSHEHKSPQMQNSLLFTLIASLTSIQPDFAKIGDLLGQKPHTLYCRYQKLIKNANGGEGDSTTPFTAETMSKAKGRGGKSATKAGGGRKRKAQAEENDDNEEAPKAKVKKGKGGKVKSEPVEDDDDEGMGRYATPLDSFGDEKGGREEEDEGYDEAFMGI